MICSEQALRRSVVIVRAQCTWNQSWNPFADFVVLTLLFGFSLSLSSPSCRARRTVIVLGSLFVSIYYLHTRIISNGFTFIVQPKTNGITYFKRARAVHTHALEHSRMRKRGEVEWIFHFIRFKEFKFTLDLKSFFSSHSLVLSLVLSTSDTITVVVVAVVSSVPNLRCTNNGNIFLNWRTGLARHQWQWAVNFSSSFASVIFIRQATRRQCPSLVSVVSIHRQCFAIIWYFTSQPTTQLRQQIDSLHRNKKKERIKSANWIQRNGWMRRVRLEGIHFDNG